MPERGAFGLSETCFRHSPKLGGENEEIAALLIGLTNARKTWGVRAVLFRICTTFRGAAGTTKEFAELPASWN